jgi:hypothetical protein
VSNGNENKVYLAVMLHKRRSLHAQEQGDTVNYLLLTSVARVDGPRSGSDLDSKTKDTTLKEKKKKKSLRDQHLAKGSQNPHP